MPANTTRLALTYPVGTDTTNIPNSDETFLNELDTADVVFLQGVFSSRPTTLIGGRIFYATDTAQLFYDDGTVWVSIGPVNSAAGNIAALNYGTSSAAGSTGLSADAGHSHGLPAAPSSSLTSQNAFIGSPVTVGNSVSTNITSLVLSIGSWAIHGQACIEPQGGNTAYYMDAYITATSAGAASSAVASASFESNYFNTLSCDNWDLVVATPTTYYLVVRCIGANGALVLNTSYSGAPNITGMTALQIAT